MIIEYDRQPPSHVTHLMYLGDAELSSASWKPFLVTLLGLGAVLWAYDALFAVRSPNDLRLRQVQTREMSEAAYQRALRKYERETDRWNAALARREA